MPVVQNYPNKAAALRSVCFSSQPSSPDAILFVEKEFSGWVVELSWLRSCIWSLVQCRRKTCQNSLESTAPFFPLLRVRMLPFSLLCSCSFPWKKQLLEDVWWVVPECNGNNTLFIPEKQIASGIKPCLYSSAFSLCLDAHSWISLYQGSRLNYSWVILPAGLQFLK